MKDEILIVVTVTAEVDQGANKDRIVNKTPTRAYNEGWERIFGAKEKPATDKLAN
jgi:hypothetical protein